MRIRVTNMCETTLCKWVYQPAQCEMAERHSRRGDCQLVVDCGGIGATKPLIGIGNQPTKADAGHLGRARAVVLATLSRRAKQPGDFSPAATSTSNRGLDQ